MGISSIDRHFPARAGHGQTVLIHTPVEEDAEIVGDLLTGNGPPIRMEPTVESLCADLEHDGAVAIIAEEGLNDGNAKCVLSALRGQPSWSDFPIIVLTNALTDTRRENSIADQVRREGNVTLLERPLHGITLLSAVESALRARRRQYEARDYLLERERAEEKVRQSQKMDAVGQLAGGVAHEVNNMMTAVIGFGELALRRKEVPAAVRADLKEIVKAGRRAAAITQQLLAFSRQQIRKRTVLDVREAIAELAPLIQRLLGEAVELDFQVAGDAGRILADRNQIDQVLINLAVNARDAMPAGGRVSVAAEVVDLDADFGRTHGLSTLRTGRYTQITVSDDGTGMDPAIRERAFEPFFSTKPTGKGTGLGLSTVYGIVKQSDGYIWLHSEPGSGTTVRIHLPAVEEEVTQITSEAPSVRGGRETILVVEDEEVVRRMAASVLGEQGYNVLMAEDGQDGLDVLHEAGSEVDLVLCDTVMPRLNGREFARRAHQLYPSLPVLYMSGYASQDVADRGLLEREASFLQKPFSPDALTRYVRELLDSRNLRPA